MPVPCKAVYDRILELLTKQRTTCDSTLPGFVTLSPYDVNCTMICATTVSLPPSLVKNLVSFWVFRNLLSEETENLVFFWIFQICLWGLCRTLWWRESWKQLQAWRFYKPRSTSRLQRDLQRWVLAACCSPQWSIHAQATLHDATGTLGAAELEDWNNNANDYWSSTKKLYPFLLRIE